MFEPASGSVDAVHSWLESYGIRLHRVSQSANKQWLQFDAITKEVEGLLRTEYYVYEHLESGDSSIACEEFAPVLEFLMSNYM